MRCKPKDINSFLFPLVDEFRGWGSDGMSSNNFQDFLPHNAMLTFGFTGISMRHFGSDTSVNTFGHIVIVGADKPALAMLQNFKGHNAKAFCNKCELRGIYSYTATHVYFPCACPTVNVPSGVSFSRPSYTPREILSHLGRTKDSVEHDRNRLRQMTSKVDQANSSAETGEILLRITSTIVTFYKKIRYKRRHDFGYTTIYSSCGFLCGRCNAHFHA
jgi:hypothetical protein